MDNEILMNLRLEAKVNRERLSYLVNKEVFSTSDISRLFDCSQIEVRNLCRKGIIQAEKSQKDPSGIPIENPIIRIRIGHIPIMAYTIEKKDLKSLKNNHNSVITYMRMTRIISLPAKTSISPDGRV